MFRQIPHTPTPVDGLESDMVKPSNVQGFLRFVPGEQAVFVPIEAATHAAQTRQELAFATARVLMNGQLDSAIQ